MLYRLTHISSLIAFLTVSISFGLQINAQAPPPPPARAVKSSPAETTDLTEAELEAKVIVSVSRPTAWKNVTPPGFDVSVDLPREPISRTDKYFEEGLGNVALEMRLSVGDGVIFMVGRMKLPYTISDDKVLRETYSELAKGFAEEGEVIFGTPREFSFNGKLAMEISSVSADSRDTPFRLRSLISGQAIYIFVAMPSVPDAEGKAFTLKERSRIKADIARFFDSIHNAKPASVAPTAKLPAVPPMFASTFDRGIFTSDYFKFTFQPPIGWIIVSQDDVKGIQQIGRDTINVTAGTALNTAKARHNIATFSSKPLGSEGISLISVNLGFKSTGTADVEKMAKAVEEFVAKVPIYTVTKPPTPIKLGGLSGYTVETKITLSESSQRQWIFFFQRRDHVISITLATTEESDPAQALAAIERIVFNTEEGQPQ